MRAESLRKNLVLWGLLILSVFALSRLKLSVPLYDYVNYWSAGRLNVQGGDPYNLEQLLALQHQGGWTESWAIPTWYPPWALPVLMLFSQFEYSTSRLLWFLVSVCILVFAIVQSWKMYEGPPKHLWIGLLVGSLFTPTLISLMLGQASPWILLGVMCFLIYIREPRKAWLAGIFAGFSSIKPQLLILFWLALLLWSIKQRKWQVLAGSAIMVAAGQVISIIFNHNVIVEYIQSMQSSPPFYLATPTLGYYLRGVFGYDKSWLQFVPTLFGVVWLLFYWYKKGSKWDWLQEMPVLLFASLITAPFTWSHDMLVLTPALMQATILLLLARKRWLNITILVVFILANIANLVLHKLLDESWAVWMAPLLLILFLIARKQKPVLQDPSQERA
jgi:hypothetical protein